MAEVNAALPRKLPSSERLSCSKCGAGSIVLAAKTFDEAWKEVGAAGWSLTGGGRRPWYLVCPACSPRGGGNSLGPSVGVDGLKPR